MGTAVQTGFVNGIRSDGVSTFNRAINTAKGTDIASASTTDLGAALGNYVQITGTTTITSLGTVAAGAWRNVAFTGVLTLTYNATSLILPTGANITTAAGDTALFVSEGSGNWRCLFYYRATGVALVGGGGGGDASTNTSTSVDSEVVLFSGTGGKTLKRATITGTPYITSGVLGTNKVTLTQPATGSTLTIADGKTATINNSLTFTGTDSSSVNFGTGGTVLYNGGALGTPSSGTLTNCTGLPVSTGISGLGTGVATFLATPSSANLISVVTDETGSGSLVFANTPTLVTPVLGAATATSIGLANGLNGSATLATSATTADQVLLAVSSTTYRAIIAEVSVVSSTSYHVFQVEIIHDGTAAFHTVAWDVYTGVSLTSVNSDVSGGNVRLLVTPVNATTTYKVTYRAINA